MLVAAETCKHRKKHGVCQKEDVPAGPQLGRRDREMFTRPTESQQQQLTGLQGHQDDPRGTTVNICLEEMLAR